ANEDDASFPELLPGAAILLAQPLEPPLGGHSHQPGGLTMRLVVHLTGDETGEMAQGIRLLGLGLDAIRGRERRQLVVLLALALDAIPARELGDVGGPASREPAVRLPQHRTIHHWLIRARG